jgi:hypothetical protein
VLGFAPEMPQLLCVRTPDGVEDISALVGRKAGE